jgi:hypothetical protein
MGRVMIIRRSKRIYRREGDYTSTVAFIFNTNAASLSSLSEEASYIHLNSKSHKATLIIYDMKSALIFLPKCHAELPNNAMLTELDDDCVARREHRG